MMLSRLVPDSIRRNSATISRILAAVVGGYLLTNAVSVFIALLLPVLLADAVATMLLMSFAVLIAVVIWVYATTSLKKVWTVIGLGLLVSVAGSAALHMAGMA